MNEILRERDHAGFGDRNEYGSRMGGGGSGLNVRMTHLGTVSIVCIPNIFNTYFFQSFVNFTDISAPSLCGCGNWTKWGDDQKDPE